MRKKKQKGNQIVKILTTMKLAKSLDCTFEEAAQKLKSMYKTI